MQTAVCAAWTDQRILDLIVSDLHLSPYLIRSWFSTANAPVLAERSDAPFNPPMANVAADQNQPGMINADTCLLAEIKCGRPPRRNAVP
jgi:hypothetical protein